MEPPVFRPGDADRPAPIIGAMVLRRAWLVAALLGVTLAAYYPAWHGAPVWDDDGHLTKRALQSVDGLRRIWFAVGATQQSYPVVHSTFWLMHRLWGDFTTGYHL